VSASPAAPLRVPTLAAIRAARATLAERVVTTPVWRWQGREIDAAVGSATEVWLKLELFQRTGTFKPRGALLNMLALEPAALERGVTAVSAGNHAIAVAYAARTLATTAKVVMPETANPGRIATCRDWGAEVVLVADVHQAFDEVQRIEREEGRAFIHPFEGEQTVLATATIGLELAEQVADLDAVVIPIGGGGLAAGIATAIKQRQPSCRIYGIEPDGADTMHRSFAAGKPQSIDAIRTIADSLGAPRAAPYTFALCRKFVDQLVRVSDDQLRAAMALLFGEMKLAVEPAGAASTAALLGPLRDKLRNQRVALILSGANTDLETFAAQAGAAPTGAVTSPFDSTT